MTTAVDTHRLPQLPKDPKERAEVLKHVNEVAAQREQLSTTADDAYAEGNRWIDVQTDARHAKERLEAGNVRLDELEEVQARAARYHDATLRRHEGQRIKRECTEQRLRLEHDEHPACVIWTEETFVKRYLDLRAVVLPQVRELVAAYADAEAAYRAFNRATVAVLTGTDATVGTYRSSGVSNQLAAVPDFPLTREILEALATTVPRPRVYSDD